MTLVHDLLDLPSSVRKGDFVQSLAKGIASPTQTVRTYAVTPGILVTFEHAMNIINSALEGGTSQAAYLHGSFGSGKSHFMAVLNLMLDNDPTPWTRPELHPLRDKFSWIGKKKLLQLPMHFLDATSIEDKIFDTYVHWVDEHHPEAPVPALYADDALFKDAEELRTTMGDEPFFAKLNEGVVVKKGWGTLGEAAGKKWDEASFSEALRSKDKQERGKLFSALAKTFFKSAKNERDSFIELDLGLEVMTGHAKTLGFDGVILYLDELILWLAGRSSDLPFVQREIQKLVKLKESQHANRAIPLVSFIARQRDLVQLVGEQALGSDRAALDESFKHHTGRFEEVILEDSNLPAIVEHRVLRPKDELARKTLQDGFERAWRTAGKAKATLIGSIGSEEAFRQVYPFSPALIEALVALSNCLQRERTAIRLLMELLVEHLPEIELGKVIPVGDAFDVIAGGEEPFDQEMRERFDRGRKLYETEFLPMLQIEHQTNTPEKCQRLRPGHPNKLGCSQCKQLPCRNDNRLAKTLLMAALVPHAKPFKNLTVARLVDLNHGTIATPIPGAEYANTAAKIRRWSGTIGPLRVGDEGDPGLNLRLDGVDLEPIIDKARSYDNLNARKHKLRELLYEELGLPPEANLVTHDFVFRGVKRKGQVRFGNVRELSENNLRCPSDAAWYILIDYPFDEAGHGPEEDSRRIEHYREKHPETDEPTAAWLPTFFSNTLEKTLGDYVAINHILNGDVDRALAHLRIEDQAQARGDLQSLADQKGKQLKEALRAAYGVTNPTKQTDLDMSRAVDEHIQSLNPGLHLGAFMTANMHEGMHQIIERLLEHRFPQHPKFGGQVTVGKLERVRGLIENLIESRDYRMGVTPEDRKDLLRYADPLDLTETMESHTLLVGKVLKDIEQRRQQEGEDTPTVAQVRRYADPRGAKGLTPELQDLLTWTYALWAGRTVMLQGRAWDLSKLGRMPEDAQLVRPDLPSEKEWSDALLTAAKLFGITIAKRHLTARNLGHFCDRTSEHAATLRQVDALQSRLRERLDEWANRQDAARLQTAESAVQLIRSVENHDGADLVRALAAFKAETSEDALKKCLGTTVQVLGALENEPLWVNFSAAKNLTEDRDRGALALGILEDLSNALKRDELNESLKDTLDQLTSRTRDLLHAEVRRPLAVDDTGGPEIIQVKESSQGHAGGSAPSRVSTGIPVRSSRIELRSVEELDEGLAKLRENVRGLLDDEKRGQGDLEVTVTIVVKKRPVESSS